MRFVIGLIFGGALILVAAQQTDGRWLREAPAWLDRLAEATGDALALPPRPAEEAADEAAQDGDVGGARAGDSGTGMQAAALTAGVEPAQQPIPRPPDPAADRPAAHIPEPAGEDVQRLVAEIFEAPAGTDGTEQEAADPAPPVTPDSADGSPTRLETGAAADAGRAPVWVPFHSRMSADGFAERLSESLDHPFRVERQGPGRYQVVFAYTDEAERLALIDEASAVTGLPL
jgi:hypothetical protein